MTRPHRILVVDDDAGLRRTLARILSPPYRVETVVGAAEALARIEAAEFDLALLDVRLQDGDGYSLCKTFRQRRPEMDVILITGSISEPDEKLFRALEEGAFYFLFKPFDRRVLLALVERCLRLQRERFAKESFAQELAADLERARRFQQSLVPREPVVAAGWRVTGRLWTCDALGGDFYAAQTDGHGLVLAIADVVGHGVSAAMYAGMLRSTLGAALRHGAAPEAVSRELLAGIDFLDGATCATMLYGLLLPDGRLRFWNAGHPPLFVQRAQRGQRAQLGDARTERLGATGPLLHHAFRDRPLPARETALAPGDRLLGLTDGAFEVKSPADQELGLDRLESAYESLRDQPAAVVLDTLFDLIRAHGAGRPVADDVTMVVIERMAG
jgi:phosphoserine phosphatase RsbU/P